MSDVCVDFPRRLVVIGAGEGGAQSLLGIFRRLGPCRDPIIIVQRNMSATFLRQLTVLLAQTVGIVCREAQDGDDLYPGTVRVAPADRHLKIVRSGTRLRIMLQEGAKVNGSKPAIDPVLESAALVHSNVCAIILGGKGRDGCDGATVVTAAGGRIYVQDPSTTDFPEMPRNILRLNIGAVSCNSEAITKVITGIGEEESRSGPLPERASGYGSSRASRRLIVIGASTGGPSALLEFFDNLPRSFRHPIVIVQHIPAGFPRRLAENINDATGWKIREAGTRELLRDGTMLIAPGDRHLRIICSDAELVSVLDDEPPKDGNRPSADIFFASAAAAFGNRVTGIVLTGMGNDGLLGSREIIAHGGTVYAQDKASSAVWGMPGAVAQAGLCKAVKRPAAIASAIASDGENEGIPHLSFSALPLAI